MSGAQRLFADPQKHEQAETTRLARAGERMLYWGIVLLAFAFISAVCSGAFWVTSRCMSWAATSSFESPWPWLLLGAIWLLGFGVASAVAAGMSRLCVSGPAALRSLLTRWQQQRGQASTENRR